jgi:hypothetical protein
LRIFHTKHFLNFSDGDTMLLAKSFQFFRGCRNIYNRSPKNIIVLDFFHISIFNIHLIFKIFHTNLFLELRTVFALYFLATIIIVRACWS